MSSKKGKLLTCDRCGTNVFLQYTGSKEYDGGFTVYDYFESKPEGWEWISEIGDLCPACRGKYAEIKAAFLKELENERFKL